MRVSPNSDDIEMMISKFLINLPPYELQQDRIWLHLEKMFHYFIDQVIHLQPLSDFQLQDKQMKQFFTLVVEKLPSFLKLEVKSLIKKVSKIMNLINDAYSSTPVYGVVILNLQETKILLVESQKPAELFGVPKGKINEGQTPIQCACREVRQQVGINVQLSEHHKMEIFYSKNCCFYICKMQESNINVLFNKNTTLQKNKGKKKISKQIKSLVWLQLSNPLQLKLNVATKKLIQKIRSQKVILRSSSGNSNKMIVNQRGESNNGNKKAIKNQSSLQRGQKTRYRQVPSGSQRNIFIEEQKSNKNPFDTYILGNRKMYERLFQTD